MRQSLDPISSGPLIFRDPRTVGSSAHVLRPRRSSAYEVSHIHKALISVRHPASEDAVPAWLVSRLAAYPVFRPDNRSRLLRYSVDSHHIPLVKLKKYSSVLLSYHTCSIFQEHAANFFRSTPRFFRKSRRACRVSSNRIPAAFLQNLKRPLLFFRLHDLPDLADAFVQ